MPGRISAVPLACLGASYRAGTLPVSTPGAAGEPVVLAIAGAFMGVATSSAPFSCLFAFLPEVRFLSTRGRLNLTLERSSLTGANLNLTAVVLGMTPVRFHSARVRRNLTVEMWSLTVVDLNLTGDRFNLTMERWSLTAVDLDLTGVRLHSTGVRFDLIVEMCRQTVVGRRRSRKWCG